MALNFALASCSADHIGLILIEFKHKLRRSEKPSKQCSATTTMIKFLHALFFLSRHGQKFILDFCSCFT